MRFCLPIKSLLLTLSLVFLALLTYGQLPHDLEYDAMEEFYYSADGNNWTNTLANNKKWLVGSNPCNWYGVTCNSEGFVTELNLQSNQLRGTFNELFYLLTHLEVLNISGNQMGNIQRDLSANQKLKVIDFSDNVFNSIPDIFQGMDDLTSFNISGNNVVGTFPPSLLNRPQLVTINAADNKISGSITTLFGGLPSLRTLNLSGNNFTGVINSTLGDLSYLDLSDNELSGNFPAIVGQFSNLVYLNLSGNLLKGCIPASYSNHCDIKNNVFLDDNCSLGNPSFIEYCDGAECSGEVSLIAPASTCVGRDITVSAPEGYDDYLWDTPCTFGSRSASDYKVVCPLPGMYRVTVTSSKGCYLVDSIFVSEYKEPNQYTSVSFCEGGSVSAPGGPYTSAGTYLIPMSSNGCPYILYVNVTEIMRPRRTVNLSICEGEDYVIHGQTYNSAGSFPLSVTNPFGCDSLLTVNVSILENFSSTLDLFTCPNTEVEYEGEFYAIGGHFRQYEAVNGCDSIVSISVNALETFTSDVFLTACRGTQVEHDGTPYSIGNHSRTYQAANGCDSIVAIHVEELSPSFPTENYTICSGQTVEINGEEFAGGQHQQPFTNSYGCPSILYIDVEESPPYDVYHEMVMCNGMPVTYGFQHTYYQGGDYTIPYVDSEGCNYNVQLHIEEAESKVEDVSLIACDGEVASYKDENYPNSIINSNLTTVAGCDSTLIVTVTRASSSQHTMIIAPKCHPETVTVNDSTYIYTNTYEQHFTNAAGCDSTLYINVTINHDDDGEIELELCPGGTVTVNDTVYNKPGIEQQDLKTKAGCDSTLYIIITEANLIVEENLVVLCGDETHTDQGIEYSESGYYEFSFTTNDGCDSLYQLTIEKYENTSETIFDRICTGSTVEYNDEVISAGGTYTQSLKNSNECDSTLTIVVEEYSPSSSFVQRETCEGSPWVENYGAYNETGIYEEVIPNLVYCDSIITIDLIVHENTTEILPLQVCKDKSVELEVDGVLYSIEGSATYHLDNAAGCDSTLIVEVTIVDELRASYEEEICEGGSTTINGEVFNTTRTTEQYFTSEIGCDSILTVSVIVNELTEESIEVQVCTGSEVEVNDKKYYEGGMDVQTLLNSAGCDSTLTIYIEELSPSSSSGTFEICEGDPIMINGESFGNGGTFEQYFKNAVGCDSTYFINITEHKDTELTLYRYICPGETVRVNGYTYSEPKIYQQDYTNSQGCDSTLFVNVQFSPPKDTIIYDFICDEGSYEFKGNTVVSAGDYHFDTLTTRGCDSTIILSLGLLTGNDTTIHRSICEGDFYSFGDNKLYNADTYFDEIIIGGCKTPTTLVLDVLEPTEGYRTVNKCEGELFWVNGKYESEPGLYYETISSAAGCDSILISELVYQPHKETHVDTLMCSGGSIFFNNWIYDRPGSYRINRKTAFGCDSIIRFNVDLYDTIPDLFEFEVCEGEMISFENTDYGVGTFEGEYNDGICTQKYKLIVRETDLLSENATLMMCAGEEVEFLGNTYHHSGQFYIGEESGECEFVEYLTIVEEAEEGEIKQLFLCEGSDFTINETAIEVEGSYTAEFCESSFSYDVLFLNGEDLFLEKWINPSESIEIEGVSYSEAGTYEILVGLNSDCPSLLYLTIIVEECGGERRMIVNKCDGDSYDFFGETISSDGEYAFEKELSFGCDSLIYLDITFSSPEDFTLSANTLLCPGEKTDLFGPDGYDYLWSTGQSSQSISVSNGGLYSLQIFNDDNCSNYAEIEIQNIEFPDVIDLTRIAPQSCEVGDGSIIVEVMNPENYQFSIDGGVSWQVDPAFNELQAGTYAVLLSDRTLTCFTSFALPITLENKGIPKIIDVEIEHVNSCVADLGSINIIAEARTSSEMLNYSIDGGQTWSEEGYFEHLSEGVYDVQVSPLGSPCVNDFLESIEILNKGDLEIEAVIEKEISCEFKNDAVVSVEILGGSSPFKYLWSTGDTLGQLEDLSPGSYSVTVEDGNGCMVAGSIDVADVDFQMILRQFRDTVICENDTIEIKDLDSTFYYYLLKEGQLISEGITFKIDAPGPYSIIAERGEDCSVNKDFTVGNPDLEAMGIDFLMSTVGIVGEEVVLVNISDPMPDYFEWVYDTSMIDLSQIDAFSQRLIFNDLGVHEITYQATIDNCLVSLVKQIEINSGSSEEQDTSSSVFSGPLLLDWKVSPNPNNGQFKVEVDLSESASISLALYDIYGAKIAKEELSGKAKYAKVYNAPHLGPGVYSIVLEHAGQVFQKSILIIR